jgi:hypothetical protein
MLPGMRNAFLLGDPDAGQAFPLLAAKTIQIPLQLRRPLGRIIRKAPCPSLRPQLAINALILRRAVGIALIDPIPLRLAESVLEVAAA